MDSKSHSFFGSNLTAEEKLLSLDERIAAAVKAMVQEVGLADNGPILKRAIEMELNRAQGKWVFGELAREGIQVDGKYILDSGAGLGAVSAEAVARNATPVAVEPGSGWHEIASERLRSAGRGSVVDAIGENLPFSDQTFDLVLSVQVLEHVEDPAAYLREAFRVLRPGGYLWLSCENYLGFREAHYQVVWLPLLPKWLGAAYLRLRGRPTAFLWHSVTYTTSLWVSRLLRSCGFVTLEEIRLRNRVDQTRSGRARFVRRLLGSDRMTRWILRLKLVGRLCRPLVLTIAQRPEFEMGDSAQQNRGNQSQPSEAT